MNRVIFKSILIFTLIIHSVTNAEIADCYAEKSQSLDMSKAEETYETVVSYFDVLEDKDERITFYYEQSGANGHGCSVPGYAKKIDENIYVFLDKKEYWSYKGFELYGGVGGIDNDMTRCILIIRFDEKSVSITSSGWCDTFCGARASIGSTIKRTDDESLCRKRT